MAAVRTLVADDHDVLRLGVRATLEENPDWKVVAEARDGQEAVAKAREFEPDVAILDYSMPRIDDLEAAREIVEKSAKYESAGPHGLRDKAESTGIFARSTPTRSTVSDPSPGEQQELLHD